MEARDLDLLLKLVPAAKAASETEINLGWRLVCELELGEALKKQDLKEIRMRIEKAREAEVSIDIAYPHLQLLASTCDVGVSWPNPSFSTSKHAKREVGVGALKALQRLFPSNSMDDPRDVLGNATRAANSSQASAAQSFWRLLAKVESLAQKRFAQLPLVLEQVSTRPGQLSAVTMQVQLCEWRQFLDFLAKAFSFSSARNAVKAHEAQVQRSKADCEEATSQAMTALRRSSLAEEAVRSAEIETMQLEYLLQASHTKTGDLYQKLDDAGAKLSEEQFEVFAGLPSLAKESSLLPRLSTAAESRTTGTIAKREVMAHIESLMQELENDARAEEMAREPMHYVGTFKTGEVFDSSRKAGQPIGFQVGLGQVIRGWDEGVMQMSLGEKARLDITSDFAYGRQGAGDVIPPNTDLVFEVELLAINEKEAPKEPTMGFTKQTEAEQKREEGKHGNIAVRQHYE
eukprot:g27345.t1